MKFHLHFAGICGGIVIGYLYPITIPPSSRIIGDSCVSEIQGEDSGSSRQIGA